MLFIPEDVHYDILYTNGCSMTNHSPLEDHEKWPTHLAEIMNIPEVINNAQGMGSNYRIFRTAYNAVKNFPENKKVLAIIQLTVPFRFEYPRDLSHDLSQKEHMWQRYNTQSFSNEKLDTASDVKKYFANYQNDYQIPPSDDIIQCAINGYRLHKTKITTYNDQTEAYELLMQANAISNIFKSNNIDCYFLTFNCSEFMRTGIEDHVDFSTVNWMYENPYDSQINRFYAEHMPDGWQVSETDGHPNGLGNQIIAERMYNRLIGKDTRIKFRP